MKKHIDEMVAKGMAEGGVVKRPMLAALAERGPEAVIPLRELSPALLGGGRGQPPVTITMTNNFSFTGPISSDVDVREVADKVSNLIAEKLAMKYRARRMMYA